ncbi:hypothetical protein [Candidatus Pelagibacter sp. HIMB1746]|uniref:hypothetical protein n=1 Tax=Candidatus Pelagibacter sp. HIMB1746 TaxID=3413370 RepID=UPI003F87D294
MYLIKLLKQYIKKNLEKIGIIKTLESLKILNSKILINQNTTKMSSDINDYEFSVFSQFGEDGIIQYLIHSIEDIPKRFIEFGVEDYEESNTRFLLLNNNWSGLVLDGDKLNISRIRNSYYYWKYNLEAKQQFITAENINLIIGDYLQDKSLGILSIDIDGNDYWILKSLDFKKLKPIFLICEYNSLLGSEASITIPYQKNFVRENNNFDKLYYGASINAINNLANKKGYFLLGSNSNGNNLFFVNQKYADKFKIKTVKEAYFKNSFKEYSNLSFEEAQNSLKTKIFFETETEKLIKF